MQDHQRAAIAELTARLASDNLRVIAFIDSLIVRVENLVDAAAADDWQEVQRVSDYVARSSATYGYPLISESAQMLSAAVSANDELLMKQRLLKLIGACGRTERPASEMKPLKS
jgi:hypothetical protein